MAFDVTFLPGTPSSVYSDAKHGGSKVAINVAGTGGAGNTRLTFFLSTDAAGTNQISSSIATVIPVNGSSGANGDVNGPLTISFWNTPPATVFLNVQGARAADIGSVQVTPYFLAPIEVSADPVTLEAGGAITMTASNVKQADGTNLPADIPLSWVVEPSDAYSNVQSASEDDATILNTSDYNWVSNNIPLSDIKADGQGVVKVTFMVGDPTYGLSIGSASTVIQARLDAPIFQMSYLYDQTDDIIIQSMHDSCTGTPTNPGSGYPVIIPIVYNGSEEGDSILLYAYDQTDTARAVRYPLMTHVVSPKEAGHRITIYVPTDTSPLDINGFYNLAYRYSKVDMNLGDSEPLPIQVDLDTPNPYGDISAGLTQVDITPNPYVLNNFNNRDPFNVTVKFTGSTKPKVGDTIEPNFHVVGYTGANFNVPVDKNLPAYTVTQADVNSHRVNFPFPDATSTPPRAGWTFSDLAGIDGSNGGVYFKYKAATLPQTVSSPPRPWTIDTVAPYSAPPELEAKIQKARDELQAKIEAHTKK